MSVAVEPGSRRQARGLTLIDMAVALTVMAILAAVIVPALASQSRNLQAEELVEEVQMIMDASKWYYYNENLDGALSPKQIGLWPGQPATNPQICGYKWFETVGQHTGWPANAIRDLEDAGYLGDWRNWKNPWGEDYLIDGFGHPVLGQAITDASRNPNCWMRITTTIPIEAIPAVRPFFPNLACYGVNSAAIDETPIAAEGCHRKRTPPAGFWRCCVHVPRPGREVNLWYQIMDIDGKGFGTIPCSPWDNQPGTAPDGSGACPIQDDFPW